MAKKTLAGIENLLSKFRDERLIRLTLDGDSKAFDTLISFYRKRITAIGISFFKNADDADDFVQEVFVKVYVNLPNFRFQSSFFTWMTSIAYKTAINSVKRRQEYMPLLNEELLTDRNLTPEEEQIRRITIETIRQEIAALPENYSICLELYFFYDLSYDEISKVTGYPLNTLKSHIFRAKKMLSEKLRGFYEQ